jgi:asparagine N-glycosylation enzyme membrane subunit Stt3
MRRTSQPLPTAWVLPAAVVALALAVRLAPWGDVFTPAGVSPVGDSDPHYHVLRAARWLAGAPGAPWRDAWLAWPSGADVPWPPLFDALIALPARAVFGPSPSRDQVATVAVLLPVLLGVALVLLLARLGRRLLGGKAGWVAAALCALAPAATEPTRLGRADQHALEMVLFTAMLLALAWALDPWAGRRGPPASLALLVPAAFWSWPGSALHLLVLALVTAALHLLAKGEQARAAAGRAARTLAWGVGAGAVLLAGSVGALGPPGALGRFTLTGVSGLHVALTAATAAFAALLVTLERDGDATPVRRLGRLAAAVAAPAIVLLLVPATRAGVGEGLARLLAATPWHAEIDEFQPLFLSGRASLGAELLFALAGYGLLLPAAALAFWPGRGPSGLAEPGERPARQDPARLLLLASLVALTVAVLLRRRFGVYAIVPLAVAAEAGLRRAAAWLPGRLSALRPPWRQALVLPALTLLAVAPGLPEHLSAERSGLEDEVLALRWLSTHPAWEGREAVLAPWSLGHLVQFHAGRPVLVGPFGTDLGPGAFDASAAFWFSSGQAEAEAVLAQRRCGVLVLGQLPGTTQLLHDYAPAGTPAPFVRTLDGAGGERQGETEAFWSLVPVRLYYDDGRSVDRSPALDGFRLLLESPATSPGNPAQEQQVKVFEWVQGARAQVTAPPGALVRASVALVTVTGRALEWMVLARADEHGAASLRLPYATGTNGTTQAGPWSLEAAGQRARLDVGETDVVQGRVVAVELAGKPGAPAAR